MLGDQSLRAEFSRRKEASDRMSNSHLSKAAGLGVAGFDAFVKTSKHLQQKNQADNKINRRAKFDEKALIFHSFHPHL